jgi:hypothetical protein
MTSMRRAVRVSVLEDDEEEFEVSHISVVCISRYVDADTNICSL